MPRVLVLDDIAQEGLDMLEAAPGIEYEIRLKLKGDDLKAALNEFDGAVCRSGVTITPESLEGNTRMKAIVRAGVGTDNIDKPSATRAGIVVMNTPDGNTVSTAEHAFALMLGLSRKVAPAFVSLKEGRWDRKLYMGTQLAGKTLGVIGLGRIGLEVAKRAQAFDMSVIAFDPFLTEERAKELGVTKAATIDDMLPKIDYLTVHTPLTPETKGLINMASLEKVKPGLMLINCARGGIYEEEAMVEGLKSGKLGGVALDVYPEEPETKSPLFQMDNVLCTPHLGASTEEAQTSVAIEAVQLLIDYLSSGQVKNAVNMASIDPKTLATMRGYLNVAYRLGLFLAQWQDGGISSCRLHFRGEVTNGDTRLLTSAFCAGLLEKVMDTGANIVNAEMLLKERGIDLQATSTKSQGAFRSAIDAAVVTDKATHSAGGTLFGNDMPRLIRVDDFVLETFLDGVLLVFQHKDTPGIIGSVGTIFGKHGVNIAQMAVGRHQPQAGGNAIGILNLDGVPPQEAIDEVLALENLHAAKVFSMPAAGSYPAWL